MTRRGERRIPKKPKLRALKVEAVRSQAWKLFLIASIAVPVTATAVFWYQANFVMPLPKEVFDRVAGNPIIFSMSMGLVGASFLTQYYWLLPEGKREIFRKTPILILMGVSVTVVASVLLWWQDPTASARTIISGIVRRPFILGAIVGLPLEGIIIAFLLSSREVQKRCIKAMLTLLAALLMFGGPTYLMFIFQRLAVPYPLLVLFGLASFTVGVILFTDLIKGEGETEAST